jgi:phosphoserine phosphatase
MTRQKGRPFAVFDIDGTLIRWQLYHAVADALVKMGFVEAGAYDSIRSARMSWKTRSPGTSFRTYELELIRVYEEVLADLTVDQLEQAVRAVFDEYKDQVYTYTRELIEQLNLVTKHGLSFKKSVAIGDSLSDAAMLELVDRPIAFNPDKELFKRALDEGWRVVIERKNMIYEMEQISGKYQLVKTSL